MAWEVTKAERKYRGIEDFGFSTFPAVFFDASCNALYHFALEIATDDAHAFSSWGGDVFVEVEGDDACSATNVQNLNVGGTIGVYKAALLNEVVGEGARNDFVRLVPSDNVHFLPFHFCMFESVSECEYCFKI